MPSTDSSKKPKPSRLGRGLGSLFSSETLESKEAQQPTSPVPKKENEQLKIDRPLNNKPSLKTDAASDNQAIANGPLPAKGPASTLTPMHSEVRGSTPQVSVAADQHEKDVSANLKIAVSAANSTSKEKTNTNETISPKEIKDQRLNHPEKPNASGATILHAKPLERGAATDSLSEVKEEHRIWIVPVDKVRPAKDQPRKDFNAEDLKELALSIRQKGIIQPITVRKGLEGDFEIVAGERRWRAAQQAGLHEVPVIIKRLDKQAALEIALIENIQRQDLNPIEESEAYNYLLTKYHLTQQQLADKVGKERATVANSLRLLVLAPEVRLMVKDGQLSVGHAKVLLSLPNHDTQRSVAKKIMNLNLSVRATEKLVIQAKGNLDEKNLDKLSEDVGGKLAGGTAQELQKILGRKVSVDYKAGKGKLSIHFHSDEELSDVIEKLKNSWKN